MRGCRLAQVSSRDVRLDPRLLAAERLSSLLGRSAKGGWHRNRRERLQNCRYSVPATGLPAQECAHRFSIHTGSAVQRPAFPGVLRDEYWREELATGSRMELCGLRARTQVCRCQSIALGPYGAPYGTIVRSG